MGSYLCIQENRQTIFFAQLYPRLDGLCVVPHQYFEWHLFEVAVKSDLRLNQSTETIISAEKG